MWSCAANPAGPQSGDAEDHGPQSPDGPPDGEVVDNNRGGPRMAQTVLRHQGGPHGDERLVRDADARAYCLDCVPKLERAALKSRRLQGFCASRSRRPPHQASIAQKLVGQDDSAQTGVTRMLLLHRRGHAMRSCCKIPLSNRTRALCAGQDALMMAALINAFIMAGWIVRVPRLSSTTMPPRMTSPCADH